MHDFSYFQKYYYFLVFILKAIKHLAFLECVRMRLIFKYLIAASPPKKLPTHIHTKRDDFSMDYVFVHNPAVTGLVLQQLYL